MNPKSDSTPVPIGPTLELDNSAPAAGHAKVLGELSRLMRGVAEAREQAARNEKLLVQAQERFAAEFVPLLENVVRWKRACLTALLNQLKAGWMKPRQAAKIHDAVEWLIFELEENFDQDLSDLRKDFLVLPCLSDEEGEEIRAGTEEFGASFDEFMGFFEPGPGPEPEDHPGRYRQQKRGTGAKTKAKQRAEEQEQSLLGDMRGLYLLLARALHPDKETDPALRAEKTAWMQKLSAAYQARNLHGLFDILARNPLNAIGPYLSVTPIATLKAYAKRLRREVAALRSEADAILEKSDPRVSSFFTLARFNEHLFRQEIAAVKRLSQATRSNAKGWLTREGVLELIELLKTRSPVEIL